MVLRKRIEQLESRVSGSKDAKAQEKGSRIRARDDLYRRVLTVGDLTYETMSPGQRQAFDWRGDTHSRVVAVATSAELLALIRG